MGDIQVWARPVRIPALSYTINPAWHPYFVYTDNNGAVFSLSIGQPTGSVYGGKPTINFGPWEATPDWRRDGDPAHKQLTVIYDGPDAGQKFELLKIRMETIAQNNLYYFTNQNSASGLNSTLVNSGFPPLTDALIREHGIWMPGLSNTQLNFVPDGTGHQVAHAEDGTLTFVVDGIGTPISFQMVAPNGNRAIATYDGVSGQVATVNFTDASGHSTAVANFSADASSTTRYFDVGDQKLWNLNVVHRDSADFVIADIRDYTAVANDWVAHHTLPTANLWQVDSEFITDFSAQVERAALHGLSVEQPVPAPIDYERTGFGFDLGAYAFDPSGTTFSLGGSGGSGSGFDLSGHIYGGGGALTLGLKVSVETNLMDMAFGGLGWLFPVVLDLDGNGVRIEPRMDSRVFFNADGDAALERTAWVGAGDGLLAHDVDGNGQITRADEIAFADRTPDPNDSDLTALATLYDANADGVLNAGDAIWNQLRVWKDANRNGRSDIGELNSLAAWGISAISLTSDHRSFSLPDGSRVGLHSQICCRSPRDAASRQANGKIGRSPPKLWLVVATITGQDC